MRRCHSRWRVVARRSGPIVAACVLAMSVGPVGAQSAAEPPPAVEEVLVTGEQPGPGLWRVSHGTHELWILGTLDPLPKNLRWRSRQADALIARSQAVLAPPVVQLHIGFFKGLSALPEAFRARKDPAGQPLRETLTPQLYARWAILRDRYLGSGTGAERFRPIMAARELYRHAIARMGLTSDAIVWNEVRRSASAHHVPVTKVEFNLTVDDPKGTLREFERIPHDPDVACLTRTIERLETDVDAMRARANLWSRGDIEGLRKLPYPDDRAACLDAVASVPALRTQLSSAHEKLTEIWLAAADAALAGNASSFAVLPIVEIMQPDGWLDRLRARGYRIEDPSCQPAGAC